MGIFLRSGGASLLVAGTVAFFAPPASADELLIMPFSCKVAGGQPVLTPSHDEGHRIIGLREQRAFAACSPQNPEMCRRWMVYRFDVDCGGVRVPWTSIAAAADRLKGDGQPRAWVENGQLHLPMPPRWNMAPEDPCARWSNRYDPWGYGRFARDCAERRAQIPPAVVDMPTGFAPTLGMDAIFVPAPPGSVYASAPPAPMPTAPASPSRVYDAPAVGPTSSIPPPPKAAHIEPPRSLSPAATQDRPPPAPQDKVVKQIPAKPQPQLKSDPQPAASPAPQSTAAIVPKIINKSESLPDEASKAAAPQTTPPKLAAAREETSGSTAAQAPATMDSPAAAQNAPVIPKIINRAGPGPDENSPPAPEVGPQQVATAAPEPAPAPAAKEAASPPNLPTPPVANTSDVVEGRGAISVSLVNAVRTPATAALIAAGLTALLLMAFVVQRWRDRAQRSGVTTRDFASVSLDGSGTGDRGLTLRSARANGPDLATPSHPRPPARPISRPVFGDAIPRTRAEALEVLGMGVTPDAGEAALKKIVDGLRSSWHPDRASDESDRQLRELRMKQINAAWDILAGKRSES